MPKLGIFSASNIYGESYLPEYAFDGDTSTFAHTAGFHRRPWIQAVITEGSEGGGVAQGQPCKASVKGFRVLGRQVKEHPKLSLTNKSREKIVSSFLELLRSPHVQHCDVGGI